MTHAMLVASVGALATGPVVARLARSRPGLLSFVDGFVLIAIGGLVMLEVIPHALAEGDWLAGLFMVAGFTLPTMAERLLHYGVRQTHTVVLLLALIGIAIHSALDGSALAQVTTSGSALLGYGVILHQLPVSLMVWWVLDDRPRAWTWGALSLMAATTVAGYVAEPAMFSMLPKTAGVWFEALVGGSLLHVIAHSAHDHDHDHAHNHAHNHTHDHSHDHAHEHSHSHAHDHSHDHAHGPAAAGSSVRWASGIGALVGAALLVLLHVIGQDPAQKTPGHATWSAFLSLAFDSAPAVLLAYVAAGLFSAWVPPGSLAWMSRGSRVRQGFAGMAVGLPLPICSCGVVPLYQQLIQQGASTTAAIAFLIATPELGIDAILLSFPLLGEEYAILRIVAAAVTAMVVALVMGRGVQRSARGLPLFAPDASHYVASTREKLGRAVRSGFGDLVDHTAPWILVGLLIAAILQPVLTGSCITRMPTGLDVLVFAAVGLPLYICASASTPLVAVLVAAGVSPGAGLALLLTGPATNVSTIGILTRMHGRRFAIGFSAMMMVTAISLGLAVNAFAPRLASTQPALAIEAVGTPLQWIAVVCVGALYVAAVLRRGARGFLKELSLSDANAMP
jgi:uncharacterized membrane protein YraQ (UPF0718 family)